MPDYNFNKILPNYFFRLNAEGSLSNGSGTGNETASEHFMMRKFMVDSLKYWATEYNVKGFRFDLMALHDVETMNLIATELHKIDPTIIIYGEPWTGGTTPLQANKQAGKSTMSQMPISQLLMMSQETHYGVLITVAVQVGYKVKTKSIIQLKM